jgi:hypothetical protein
LGRKKEQDEVLKLLEELELKSPAEILESVSSENIFIDLKTNTNGTGIIFNYR